MLDKKAVENAGKILNIDITKFIYYHKEYMNYEVKLKNVNIGFSKMKKLHDAGYDIVFTSFNTLDIF